MLNFLKQKNNRIKNKNDNFTNEWYFCFMMKVKYNHSFFKKFSQWNTDKFLLQSYFIIRVKIGYLISKRNTILRQNELSKEHIVKEKIQFSLLIKETFL